MSQSPWRWQELFRGSVVLADRALDLALVKIESGLYGQAQALPAGYRRRG